MLDGLAGCPVLRLIEPQGAFYAFVDVRLTGLDSGEFADRLLDEEHVAVVPGEAFGEEGRGFVRLSYAGDAGELRGDSSINGRKCSSHGVFIRKTD